MIPFGFIIPNTYVKCWEMNWAYNHETKIIYLCDGIQWNKEFYKQHEIWHYFWFNIMTQSQRDSYTKIWTESKWFYRDYGKTSAIEDFADNFAVVATNKNILRIRQKTNFIKKIINIYAN